MGRKESNQTKTKTNIDLKKGSGTHLHSEKTCFHWLKGMSESDVSFKHPEKIRKLENNRSWGGDVYYLIANSL